MQREQKKRMIQKLWGWICVAINSLVMSLHLAGQHAELLNGGIVLSVLTILYGVIKTQADKRKGDLSVASIVIEYVCVYIITFLAGLKVMTHISSVSVLISLTIASIAEMLFFLLLTDWRAICRFFCQSKRGTRGHSSTGDGSKPLKKSPV